MIKARNEALNFLLSTITGNIETITQTLSNPFTVKPSFIEKVTNLTPSLITVYNLKTGRYVYINKALKSLLGYETEEWLKKGVKFVIKLVHPQDLTRILDENQKAIESDNPHQSRVIEFEYRIKNSSGSYRWLRTYGAVFDRDNSGNVKHVINISLDITTLKENEEKVHELRDSLDEKVHDISEHQQIEKQKDEFISIASHELKTPLTTIKSFTEILKMQFGKEEKALHYLNKMNAEIDRLTDLVNELLDVSKIKSGGLSLNKASVRIDKFIEEVVEDIQTTSTQHKIVNKNNLKIKIFVDKHRLYQVLINLISNAIKYSPKADKILISTAKKAGMVEFRIKDYGIGITQRDKKKIFDAFFQASTSIRQSYSGLGLGLHISKEIIHKHGGKISVDSKKGIGSTFRIHLPIKKDEK